MLSITPLVRLTPPAGRCLAKGRSIKMTAKLLMRRFQAVSTQTAAIRFGQRRFFIDDVHSICVSLQKQRVS